MCNRTLHFFQPEPNLKKSNQDQKIGYGTHRYYIAFLEFTGKNLYSSFTKNSTLFSHGILSVIKTVPYLFFIRGKINKKGRV